MFQITRALFVIFLNVGVSYQGFSQVAKPTNFTLEEIQGHWSIFAVDSNEVMHLKKHLPINGIYYGETSLYFFDDTLLYFHEELELTCHLELIMFESPYFFKEDLLFLDDRWAGHFPGKMICYKVNKTSDSTISLKVQHFVAPNYSQSFLHVIEPSKSELDPEFIALIDSNYTTEISWVAVNDTILAGVIYEDTVIWWQQNPDTTSTFVTSPNALEDDYSDWFSFDIIKLLPEYSDCSDFHLVLPTSVYCYFYGYGDKRILFEFQLSNCSSNTPFYFYIW